MQHLDEGTIHAWLDGALDADAVRGIEAHLAECASCASAVAEARGLIAASSRILSALDLVPGNVTPETQVAAAPRAARTRWVPRVARIAAVAAIAVAGATVAMRRVMSPRSAGEAHMVRARTDSGRASVDSRGASADSQGARVDSQALAARAQMLANAMKQVRESVQAHTVHAKRAELVAAAPSSTSAKSTTSSTSAKRATSSPSAELATEARRSVVTAPIVVAPLRLVSTEQVVTPDAHIVVRRIYEVHPGVRVTLDEATAAGPRIEATESRAFAPAARPAVDVQRAGVVPAAPTPVADSTGAAPMRASVNSIEWTGAAGAHFTLRGPLTVEELQQLKARLP